MPFIEIFVFTLCPAGVLGVSFVVVFGRMPLDEGLGLFLLLVCLVGVRATVSVYTATLTGAQHSPPVPSAATAYVRFEKLLVVAVGDVS